MYSNSIVIIKLAKCGDPTPQKENRDRRERTLSIGNRPTEQ